MMSLNILTRLIFLCKILKLSESAIETEIIDAKSVHNKMWNVTCKRNTELLGSKSCWAEKCARTILDGLFLEKDIADLHNIASKGFAQRPTAGGPSSK